MQHEFFAAQSYLALSAWCDARHLDGLAKFFRVQFAEEQAHALRLFDFILNRGATPSIGVLSEPKSDFEMLLDVAKHAQTLERTNTSGIHEAYKVALEAPDYPTQIMLQWFIVEQMEEEHWADELVAKVKMAGCAGAMSMLNHRLEKRSKNTVEDTASPNWNNLSHVNGH